MAVTINEIAQLANVSRATVDKVIHHRPGVKKETRERVEFILKNMDYRPNLLGKALVHSKNPMKIGIILPPDYNAFIQVLLKGIHKAQAEYAPFGFEVVVKMLTSLEPVEFMGLLLQMEAENVNGLAMIPIDDPQVIKKINQMEQNGIHILTFNSPIKELNGFCYVGQDHKKAGTVAAGLMEKLLPQGGKIGVIISSHSLTCHTERLDGFCSRLFQSPNEIQIIGTEENQDKQEDAFRIALSYLNRYPDLMGFYLSGNGCRGVQQALSIANISHPVKMICHDLVPESVQMLQDGCLDFVITQNAQEQGYQIVKQLFEYLMLAQKPADYFYEIPIQIVTKELL